MPLSKSTALSRLYEQKQAVTAYATEHDIPTLDAQQWHLIVNVIIVLKPIEEITKIASADDESIGYVIPSIATLQSYLSKRTQSQEKDIMILKEDLKKSIEKRFLNFSGKNIQESSCFTHATFLDPRFKTRFLKDEVKVKKLILDELLAINRNRSNDEQNISNSKDKTTDNDNAPSFSESLHDAAHESIWQCFDEIANGSKSDVDSVDTSTGEEKNFNRQPSDRTKKKTIVFTAEIDKYLVMPLITRKEDPVVWWKTHASELPNLKILFLKYCSAPPSSVNSERLFSAAAAVYTEDRNRLLPDNAEMLI
ncbi:Zinc finger BED domain-containing protein 4, partial [Temnothorax longispinosus]